MKKVRDQRKNSTYLIWITGILIALTISCIASAILGGLLLNGKLDEKSAVIFIAAIQLISVFAGVFIAGRRKSNQYI